MIVITRFPLGIIFGSSVPSGDFIIAGADALA